jgi:hypothetical protein
MAGAAYLVPFCAFSTVHQFFIIVSKTTFVNHLAEFVGTVLYCLPEHGVVLGERIDGVSTPEVVLLANTGAAHQAVQRGVSLKTPQLAQTDLLKQ